MMSVLKRGFSLSTKLGRWKIEHDLTIINIKIDQANKDNSSAFYPEKNKEKDSRSGANDFNKELKDDFLLPYCI